MIFRWRGEDWKVISKSFSRVAGWIEEFRGFLSDRKLGWFWVARKIRLLSFSCGFPLDNMEIDCFSVFVCMFDVCCAIREVFCHYCVIPSNRFIWVFIPVYIGGGVYLRGRPTELGTATFREKPLVVRRLLSSIRTQWGKSLETECHLETCQVWFQTQGFSNLWFFTDAVSLE